MIRSRRFVIVLVAILIFGLCHAWFGSLYADTRKEKKEEQETYTRPKPKEPIRPEIPDANRYQEDKVFLENADSLFRPANELEEYQIVKGQVKFRQSGMWMFCDSAYYYPGKNSLIAYGNVEMQQGDTLFVYADRLYYDGSARHATLVRGPSHNEVQLKNRNVELITDSLDYDLASERGWYTTGGKLDDGVNTLTSIYGEYSPATHIAEFRNDVLLVNIKDGYRMITEELVYNTDTHIATINTKTRIEGASDTIITTEGWYDTTTDHAQLTSRSTITHRDSTNKVVVLEGDSIIYDKLTRISRAYMFRHPAKLQQPMIITDTARKVKLIGGYGEYDDSSKTAFATEYPLLLEYSRPDTLFLRADTVLSLLQIIPVWPDSLSHNWNSDTRLRLSQFTSLQSIADAMPLSLYLFPLSFPAPGNLSENQNTPVSIDSITETLITGYEIDTLRGITPDLPDESVKEQTEIVAEIGKPGSGRMVANNTPGLRIDELGRDSAFMIAKEFHVAKAIGKARFFNRDIQGVADTMIFYEYDSILNLIRRPVVWSEERQIMGDRIDVHFNDSTPDVVNLPTGGIMAEHIAEDFYNQLSGSKIKAFLENNKIKRLEVDGNVQTVFMPQEEDSTYSKMVNAESSYLTIDFKDGEMDHLRMWPEVTGTVTPVGDVKNSQKYLQGFRWLDALRPKRQWYGNYVRWIDDLGEVPDALEAWFMESVPVKAPPINPEQFKQRIKNAIPSSN